MITCRFILIFSVALLYGVPSTGQGYHGLVLAENEVPIEHAFISLMDADYQLLQYRISRQNGTFDFDTHETARFLIIQPPTYVGPEGLQVYQQQPRIFELAGHLPSETMRLILPDAVTFVLMAYDVKGELMKWGDFEALGRYAGQFMYATNTQDEAVPATCWPIHGGIAGPSGQDRASGLPAILVRPGENVIPKLLFWETGGYGKLLLQMHNEGMGYTLDRVGDVEIIPINYSLATSALHDLEQRIFHYGEGSDIEINKLRSRLQDANALLEPVPRTKAFDSILRDALRLRDNLELESARNAIHQAQNRTLEIVLNPKEAELPETYDLRLTPLSYAFSFGVFEGSPYNAQAFEAARSAGFDMATVLLGWNWTKNPETRKQQIDQVYGLSRLKSLGYDVKAHGVMWLQEYDILPDFIKTVSPDTLLEAAESHVDSLLDTFGDQIDVWEAMNEPSNTNVMNVPKETVYELVQQTAAQMADQGKPVILNAPHEFAYGSQYLTYLPDGEPTNGYPVTYTAFLEAAENAGVLEHIDVIGLQFYPGFRFSTMFAGLNGPAYTPAHVQDIIERYTRFNKSIHITEFSLPSSYGADWTAGYWKAPWAPELQADYAEHVYTLAYAHPQVHSVTWWDVMDTKPAVITGGLIHSDGTPKPVFNRIADLIAHWRAIPETESNSAGVFQLQVPEGTYMLEVIHEENTIFETELKLTGGISQVVDVDLSP